MTGRHENPDDTPAVDTTPGRHTGEATARCTQCHGTGTACLNLIGATP